MGDEAKRGNFALYAGARQATLEPGETPSLGVGDMVRAQKNVTSRSHTPRRLAFVLPSESNRFPVSPEIVKSLGERRHKQPRS